jgi:hypothetical protein
MSVLDARAEPQSDEAISVYKLLAWRLSSYTSDLFNDSPAARIAMIDSTTALSAGVLPQGIGAECSVVCCHDRIQNKSPSP